MMNNWLSGFANRISMTWWIFALPSLMVIGIALLTVSMHTLRAATTNPWIPCDTNNGAFSNLWR